MNASNVFGRVKHMTIIGRSYCIRGADKVNLGC